MSGRYNTGIRALSSRTQVILLVVSLLGCLTACASKAGAAPIILPSAHPIATPRTIAIELVPPQKAKVCAARIAGAGHSTRRFPVRLGGPSRRLSWHIAASGHARWTVSVTCGTRSKPTSLGTTHRTFMLRGIEGHPGLRVSRGSFRSTRGFLPAHAPPPLSTAQASSVSSEADTSAASQCTNNPYMSNAYGIGRFYASRVGFTPTQNRVSNLDDLWHSIEGCLHLPDLLNGSRESMFKQMACQEFYGPPPGPGVTYDMDGWREDPTWEVAMKSKDKCGKWTNVDEPTADEDLQGWVIQGSLDTSSQRAAYLVEGKLGTGFWWKKDHIEDPKAYYCTLQSHNGPLVVPSDFITEELSHNGPAVGDTACNAVPPSYGPPPGTAQAGGLYLDQGPAAPGGGYWYAVTLAGFPPSSSVPITCRDSVSPNGFLTFIMHTDSAGDAQSTTGCYSGDGPEHWVTAPSAESARVTWGGSSSGSPAPSPPSSNPTRVDLYDNYGGGAVGRAMCRGNPGRPESMPGGVATETFTVPPNIASVDTALVQIDPDSTVTAHATLSVDGVARASADALAAGDTTFSFSAVPVQPGDSLSLSISFSATYGKIITVYTVGSPGGTFTASNSCPDGAPSLTTGEGLRAVISGWTP